MADQCIIYVYTAYMIFYYFFYIELPITFLTPLSDVQVYEKDEARFECEISREPKVFRWLKGTQELKADDKFDILTEGKRHILVVKSAAYDDEAKYMFEAEDKRTSAKLIIQGHYSLLQLIKFNFEIFVLKRLTRLCTSFFRHSSRVH